MATDAIMPASRRPARVLCALGAHVDDVLRLNAPARPGESVPARATADVGGCAFNVAAALVSAGHSVRHGGVRGDDASGAAVVVGLRKHSIGDVGTVVPDVETGRYVALLNPDGDLALAAAAMTIYDRADMLLAHAPFRDAARECDLMVLDANAPPAVIEALARLRGPESGLALLATSTRKAAALAPLLPEANVLFANEAEAAALGPSVAEARVAYVTKGAGGAELRRFGKRVHAVPASGMEVRNVIGAGDAFAAGALDALLGGASAEDALEAGAAWAGHCVAAPDALGWLAKIGSGSAQ